MTNLQAQRRLKKEGKLKEVRSRINFVHVLKNFVIDGQEVCAFIVHSVSFLIKLKYEDSKRCVYDNYLRDDKKRTTDHHVKEMVDSMPQKKRRGV